MRRSYGLFDSKITSSSGAPKKDPNGNWTSQNPAMKKYSQPTLTFYQHLSQTSKKKNKQCSLEDEQKSRQVEKELKDKRGKRIKAVIAQKSDRRYFLDDAQARDKFIHAPDFGVKIPESFDLEHAKSLSSNHGVTYKDTNKFE